MANNLKLAFILRVSDLAIPKTYEGRVVVTIDRVGDVDDFKLTIEPPADLEEAGFTRELKEALGLELMGAAEDGDPDMFDGLAFTGTFGGHYCDANLEVTNLTEGDDE